MFIDGRAGRHFFSPGAGPGFAKRLADRPGISGLGPAIGKIAGFAFYILVYRDGFDRQPRQNKNNGIAVLSAVVCLQVYTYGLSFLGGTAAEELKLIFLLMFVWLLLESAKKKPL
jgi:hypothetical protein